jgi:hypothetical protein
MSVYIDIRIKEVTELARCLYETDICIKKIPVLSLGHTEMIVDKRWLEFQLLFAFNRHLSSTRVLLPTLMKAQDFFLVWL